MLLFYILWKHQKSRDFFAMFSEGVEREHWSEIGREKSENGRQPRHSLFSIRTEF